MKSPQSNFILPRSLAEKLRTEKCPNTIWVLQRSNFIFQLIGLYFRADFFSIKIWRQQYKNKVRFTRLWVYGHPFYLCRFIYPSKALRWKLRLPFSSFFLSLCRFHEHFSAGGIGLKLVTRCLLKSDRTENIEVWAQMVTIFWYKSKNLNPSNE